MKNQEHLDIISQGVPYWNKWRQANPEIQWPGLDEADLLGIDLQKANLAGTSLFRADLGQADFRGANLEGADFRKARVSWADFRGASFLRTDFSVANLTGANFEHTDVRGAIFTQSDLEATRFSHADLSEVDFLYAKLRRTDLTHAILSGARFFGAFLEEANLENAVLRGTDLSLSTMVKVNLSGADLSNAVVFGVSAWKVNLDRTIQRALRISDEGEPTITTDELEVAQFIYLMLNNTKMGKIINTITSKAVLILGRFSDPQRKSVLDGLREGLRNFDLLPIVFDFDRPTDKDYTETVQTLAGLSMFVIADLTSPKSTPLELEATIKQFKIPYIPIIDISVDPRPFAMLVDSQNSFHWVLPTLKYESKVDLLDGENLKTYIIEPAFAKREQLREAKNQEPEAILIPKKKISVPHEK
jgi:uncharacterized protein YjbI with pentapeptide repeats